MYPGSNGLRISCTTPLFLYGVSLTGTKGINSSTFRFSLSKPFNFSSEPVRANSITQFFIARTQLLHDRQTFQTDRTLPNAPADGNECKPATNACRHCEPLILHNSFNLATPPCNIALASEGMEEGKLISTIPALARECGTKRHFAYNRQKRQHMGFIFLGYESPVCSQSPH